MDIAAPIFAGLGLFFIGIRLIGNHLKQLAGRRMRLLIARAVAGRGSVALFGLAAGAIMQSVNAVTYVLVALVSAGAIDTRRAFPVINWANLGTSLIVLVAALKLHVAILVLVGFTGITYYLNLDQSARYRHLVGALLGIGLLFLGIDFIKTGAAPLREAAWLRDGLALSAQYPVLAFGAGVAVALLAQSSSTVTVVAMAMAAAGVLDFGSGALIVLGAGLGSGLSAWALAGKLSGSARQLVLYQVALKGLGVAVMVLLLALERAAGLPLLQALVGHAGLPPAGQLAAVYVLLQLASDLAVRLARRPVLRHVERHAPPSDEEILGKPRYLQEHALDEPETALLLVAREQQRLVASLPAYLDSLRDEVAADGPRLDVRHAAESNVLRQCEQFLTSLMDRNPSREVLERTMVLRDRNALLASLQETLAELTAAAAAGHAADELRLLVGNLVEGLHMMLEMLAEQGASEDAEDRELLRVLTHDRSDLMDGIRRRLLGGGEGLAPEVQQAVFSTTSLFERSVWLLRRYVLLLDLAAPAEGLAAR